LRADMEAAGLEHEAAGVADEADYADLDDPEVNAAATKIQAAHRGKAARAEVAALRAEAGAEVGCCRLTPG